MTLIVQAWLEAILDILNRHCKVGGAAHLEKIPYTRYKGKQPQNMAKEHNEYIFTRWQPVAEFSIPIEETMGALTDLKKAGKIRRYRGFQCVKGEHLLEYLKYGCCPSKNFKFARKQAPPSIREMLGRRIVSYPQPALAINVPKPRKRPVGR